MAEDLVEHQQQKRDRYLGKRERKLLSRLSRLHGQVQERDTKVAERDGRITELESRLSRYEPSATEQQNGEANADGQQQPQQPSRQQLEEQYQHELAALEARVAWPHKLEAAKTRYENFDTVVKAADGHEMPLWTFTALQHAANGADMMYWLAQHTDYIDKVRELDAAGRGPEAFAVLQWISNGLQFGELHNRPAARQRSNSAAPAPIKPVASGSARSTVDPGQMDYKTFKKWRESGGGRR